MENQKKALEAFLAEQLAKHNLTLDEETLRVMQQFVTLEERPPHESQQVKSIKVKQKASGKVTAESFKLWNLKQLTHHDLLKFAYKELGILMFDDTVKKIIYAFGALLIEYFPKLTYTFDELEAKVIFAIAKLQKETFTTEELLTQFHADFEEGILKDQLENVMDELIDWKVVKRIAVQEYQLKESIKNRSRN